MTTDNSKLHLSKIGRGNYYLALQPIKFGYFNMAPYLKLWFEHNYFFLSTYYN